jgi:Tfp pilus assembly protein PilX
LEDYRGERRDRPRAQRLVVYAVILVLVAILVVVIFAGLNSTKPVASRQRNRY